MVALSRVTLGPLSWMIRVSLSNQVTKNKIIPPRFSATKRRKKMIQKKFEHLIQHCELAVTLISLLGDCVISVFRFCFRLDDGTIFLIPNLQRAFQIWMNS